MEPSYVLWAFLQMFCLTPLYIPSHSYDLSLDNFSIGGREDQSIARAINSINSILEWDELLPYAIAAFNCFANEHSQESPHFLYFGCDPNLPLPATFLKAKLRYLGSDEGMSCLNKLRQTYMLAVLNTKESCSKQKCGKHDNAPQFEIGGFIMINNFDKKSNWDAKYVFNFRVVKLIGTSQLEVPDPTGRLWKVNSSDVHKIFSTKFIVSCLLDEQILARKGKNLNDPHILKKVSVIDASLHECFPSIRLRCQ